MRQTRQQVGSPGDQDHIATRKNCLRAGKFTPSRKENEAPSLSISNEVQNQKSTTQCNVSTPVICGEEKITPDQSVIASAPTNQTPDDVGTRLGNFLQRDEPCLEQLFLDGSNELQQVKEESIYHIDMSTVNQIAEQEAGVVMDFKPYDFLPTLDECQDDLEYQLVPCYESDTATEEFLQQSEKDDKKSGLEAASISSSVLANSAIFKRAKLLPSEQPLDESSFHGNLKFHRFMMCEWFYSHIDEVLLVDECNTSASFNSLLRQYYPHLHNCALNRAQMAPVRKELGKLARVRRLSPAFLLQERIALERRREKVRFLMENPMIEYLDDDIPSIIPRRIEVGSKVRAALLTPRYGCFPGEVIGIEHQETPSFWIRFQIDGSVHEQLVPDYRVALQRASPASEPTDVLAVSVKHLKQVVQLEEYAHKKRRLLYELDNIRLNTEARRSMRLPMTARDYEQSERFEQLMQKLLDLNRTHLPVMKRVANDYEQYMAEPLATGSSVPVVDRYVVEVVDRLMKDYSQLDCIQNNPVADQMWQEAFERLQKKPEYMKQLDYYLSSNIGIKFDIAPFRKKT